MPLLRKSFVITCCMLCILYTCCKGALHLQINPLKLTADNDGQIISIGKARVLTLTLNNKVDGGYHFDSLIYNKHLLKLIKHTNVPPPPHSGLGNHGTDTWRLITINKGRSELRITASRPWKHGDTLKIFSGIIIIK